MFGRLLTCVLLMSAGWSVRAEVPEPMRLLEKMATARQELNYQGAFTYEHRNAMESFRLIHWVDNDRVYERLDYLNGPAEAAQQVRGFSDCASTGYRLLNASPEDVNRLDSHYRLTLRGTERIAGREAYLLEVRPRDELRYGYLLGLDQETGLLLKALLIDEQQRLLERFQFVELTLNPDLREVLSRSDTAPEPDNDCFASPDEQPTRWSLNWLPPGFAYSGEKRLPNSIDMLMYTDGLASFSVFLQPLGQGLGVEGRAQRGATSAYMGQLSAGNRQYRVTVVGEIPGDVAENLARGLNVLPKPNSNAP